MIFQKLTIILIFSRATFAFANDLNDTSSQTNGSNIAKSDEESDINPEELGDYPEGDIVSPVKMMEGKDRETLLWPGGQVYFDIGPEFDDEHLIQIRDAMAHINNQTCIKFLPLLRTPGQSDYVKITAENTGCWTTSIGRLGGEQLVNLQIPKCLRKMGSIVHQLVHVLGLGHEHNRPDRDRYVDILWKNVGHGYAKNFDKTDGQTNAAVLGLPYDPYSITHYSPRAFASEKQLNTIEPKSPEVSLNQIGQRDGLTSVDVQKISKLYEKQCSL